MSVRKQLLLLVLAACGGAPAVKSPTDAAKPLPALPAPDHAQYDAADARAPLATPSSDLQLTAIDRPIYEAAQAYAKDGRLAAAKRALAKLVVAYPDRPSLVADFNAVQSQIAAAQSVARASLDAHPVITLAAPPAVYTLAHPAKVDAAAIPKLTLKKKAQNEIVDDEKWFENNGISLPEYFAPPQGDVLFFGVSITITMADAVAKLSGFGVAEWLRSARYLAKDLPTWVPLSYGTIPISRAIDSAPFLIAIYGGRLVAVFDETKHARALFDLEAFTHPPANQRGQVKVGEATFTQPGAPTQRADITADTNSISLDLEWALAKDHTLFVQHANNGYAKDAKGQTAYITALDLDTGDLAWRSKPLVANASNFALVGGGVVAGYGFTAEPDFLFVLDAASGATKQKTPVPSGPESIVVAGNRALVRTYDHDLTFDIH